MDLAKFTTRSQQALGSAISAAAAAGHPVGGAGAPPDMPC